MVQSPRSSVGAVVDLDTGKRILQVLLMVLAFAALAFGLYPAVWVYFEYRPRVAAPWEMVVLILAMIFVFNLSYLLGLFVLRIIIPKHKEGVYPVGPDGRPPIQASIMMLNFLLFKVRYGVPWITPFVSTLTVIPPLSTLNRFLFGPNLPIYSLGDHVRMLDPHLVKVGKRVQFGMGAKISCHVFDKRGLLIKGVEVEDDALVGGEVWLLPGVKVGHHSQVTMCSLVKPNTVIPPYELWGGTPARKIRDLERGEKPSEALPPKS